MQLYHFYYCYILRYFLGEQWPITAVAQIDDPHGIKGNVTFKQDTCMGAVSIIAELTGLKGCYGIHIHEFGDLSDGCECLGTDWAPYKKNQVDHKNLPEFCSESRKKTTNLVATNNNLYLAGPMSIVGRSVVIQKKREKFRDHPKSLKTADTQIACGIIGLKAKPKPKPILEEKFVCDVNIKT